MIREITGIRMWEKKKRNLKGRIRVISEIEKGKEIVGTEEKGHRRENCRRNARWGRSKILHVLPLCIHSPQGVVWIRNFSFRKSHGREETTSWGNGFASWFLDFAKRIQASEDLELKWSYRWDCNSVFLWFYTSNDKCNL